MTRPSGARWSSTGCTSPCQARPVTSNTAPRRFEAVSSGPNSRNVLGLRRITSRSKAPSTRVASLVVVRRRGDRDGVVAEVRQPQVAQQDAAVGVRAGAHPPVALGRRRQDVVARRRRVVEQLLGPVRAQPRLELGERGRRVARAERAAPGASAASPSPGRSSPSACAGRASASAAARSRRPRAAVAGSPRSRRATSSSAAAICWMHRRRGRRPRRRRAGVRSPRAARAARRAGSARAPSGWRSCSR